MSRRYRRQNLRVSTLHFDIHWLTVSGTWLETRPMPIDIHSAIVIILVRLDSTPI